MDHSLEGYLQRQTTETLFVILQTQPLSEGTKEAVQALIAKRERENAEK